MGHTTTRTSERLRPSRTHRRIAAVRAARLTDGATQASDCRRGAALADRTRHRWAR